MTGMTNKLTAQNKIVVVGDFVRVSSGPSYVKGSRMNPKGRVVEVTRLPNGDAEVVVLIESAYLRGFNVEFNERDLTVVKR